VAEPFDDVSPPPGGARSDASGGDDPMLNLKQAAAVLRVHYMTVYRYVRQGRLEAERSGTEWRVSAAALERFGGAQTGSDDADWAGRLERCLLAGDEVAAWRVVESALAAARTPEFCYVDVVAAALASIGSRWEAGSLDVADQYVATAVASRIVARLGARFRRPGRSKGSVVFGAPSGEHHSLPISIAADLVRLAGFDVLELGANVPPAAFATASARTPRLVAVGVGITCAERVPAAQAAVDAVRAIAEAVPIVLGGSAAWDPLAASMRGVDAWALDGREVAAVVTTLVGRAANDRPASRTGQAGAPPRIRAVPTPIPLARDATTGSSQLEA
jgi:excisionase family DNA binding protein